MVNLLRPDHDGYFPLDSHVSCFLVLSVPSSTIKRNAEVKCRLEVAGRMVVCISRQSHSWHIPNHEPMAYFEIEPAGIC